jgi:hypothetical protein
MTPRQVKDLKPGDEVKWNDPDRGICSAIIVIAHIEIDGEEDDSIVRLTGKDGSYLECYAHELE